MTAPEPTPRRPVEVRKRPLSKHAQHSLYRRQRSFVDFLPWVEYLPEYTTASATYQDVLLVRNYRSDYELFAYDIYLARGHGVVAYERLETVWELE